MELIRGRWTEQYINCLEDKNNFDNIMRGRMHNHHDLGPKYCESYKVADLSQVEKMDIDEYWRQYGICLTDYSWHRMYYHVTGIHDPKFIPDYIAGHIVYPYYNDHAYEYTWRDKNMFDRLLPDVPLPQTYGKCCRGRFTVDEQCYSENEKSKICKRIFDTLHSNHENKMVIKPTRSSGFGRGIKKYSISTEQDVYDAITEWQRVGMKDYIIQKYVDQHSVLSSLNTTSSNMIRICSWRHDNKVDILYAAARIGQPGQFTDISFKNGKELARIIGITKDGFFMDKIVDQDGIIEKRLNEEIKIPGWAKMISIIKQNHIKIDNFDIVGWDFTVDQEENPICFEWNIQWPGTVFYQYVNGPLWGEYTDMILEFLKEEKNRYNFIPWYLKA